MGYKDERSFEEKRKNFEKVILQDSEGVLDKLTEHERLYAEARVETSDKLEAFRRVGRKTTTEERMKIMIEKWEKDPNIAEARRILEYRKAYDNLPNVDDINKEYEELREAGVLLNGSQLNLVDRRKNAENDLYSLVDQRREEEEITVEEAQRQLADMLTMLGL